jgi:hypothetical protein
MVVAASVIHPHASAQSDHQSPARPTPPHLISPLSRDIISFYTWDYSRMGQSQQVFYNKKCILMFRAMHGHLVSLA